MKKLILYIIICLLLSWYLFIMNIIDFSPTVKAGQTWKYERSNPFETVVIIKKVIAVKDGYVKYEYSGVEYVDHVKWFKIGSELVEE